MNDNFDKIEKYFDGNLQGEEKKSFENKWEHDDAFAKEIAFYLRLKKELKQEKIKNINSAIKNDINEKTKKKPFIVRRIGWSMAAGLALLIGVFFIYQLNNSKPDLSGIAANYDTPFNTTSMMEDVKAAQGIAGDDWTAQKSKMKTLDSLFIHDKAACITLSDTYINNEETSYFSRETQLLKALALKEIGEETYPASKELLLKLRDSGDTDYQDVVLWNLSIINLYEKNIDAANETLNGLVESYPNSKYTENARKILQEIN